MADDPITRDPDGAISRYKEWVDHRYDPGHYLGGRLTPLVSTLQDGKSGAEMYGSALIALSLISILLTAGMAWRDGFHSTGHLGGLAYGVLAGVVMPTAGVVAVRRARRRRRAAQQAQADGRRTHVG